jgi:hypothetical protein
MFRVYQCVASPDGFATGCGYSRDW